MKFSTLTCSGDGIAKGQKGNKHREAVQAQATAKVNIRSNNLPQTSAGNPPLISQESQLSANLQDTEDTDHVGRLWRVSGR